MIFIKKRFIENKRVIVVGAGDFRESAFKTFLKNNCHITLIESPNIKNYARLVDENIYFDINNRNLWKNLLATLLESHKEEKYHGVLPLSELGVELASQIAHQLNLIGNPRETAKVCRNKYLMRERFKSYGILNPKYSKVTSKEQLVEFVRCTDKPVILKPTDNGGSVGVIKIHNLTETEDFWEESVSKSFTHELIVEEFIDGLEFSVEVIVKDNDIKIITITDKETTDESHYFVEMGHTIPSIKSKAFSGDVVELAKNGLKALGIRNGAAHVEIKFNGEELYIIEIAARVAGDLIPELIKESFDWDYYHAILNIALNIEIDNIPEKSFYYSKIAFFKGKEGRVIKRLPKLDVYPIQAVDIQYNKRTGDKITELNANYKRIGHVIAKNKDINKLNVEVQNLLDILTPIH